MEQDPALKYRPLRKEERGGIALCLSGGGFRAALFHLGAVRRLYEVGTLSQVTTITAVSGGSLLAAHLARHVALWRDGALKDWETQISAPFRAFTSRNLSTGPILRGWVLPWYWKTNAAIEEVAGRCDTWLGRLTLSDLPDKPRFIFCAVDLVSPRLYLLDKHHEPSWSVGTAVAASSCLPGYFRPFCQKDPHRIALADGGLDDNRAIEPVWNDHDLLLVSDGGDVLIPAWSRSFFWLMRSVFVLWNQGQEVRKRWLLANFGQGEMEGAYWGIVSSPESYPNPPRKCPYYSKDLACRVLARIRTTYDAFSTEEAAVLENHGYMLADAALVHLPPGVHPIDASLKIPHCAWMSDQKVSAALSDSASAFPPRWSVKTDTNALPQAGGRALSSSPHRDPVS